MGFPGGSTVKNLPAMQEISVQSLGREDHLEKGMTTHFSILAWRIPWAEGSGGLQFMRLKRVKHNLVTKQQQQQHSHFFFFPSLPLSVPASPQPSEVF